MTHGCTEILGHHIEAQSRLPGISRWEQPGLLRQTSKAQGFTRHEDLGCPLPCLEQETLQCWTLCLRLGSPLFPAHSCPCQDLLNVKVVSAARSLQGWDVKGREMSVLCSWWGCNLWPAGWGSWCWERVINLGWGGPVTAGGRMCNLDTPARSLCFCISPQMGSSKVCFSQLTSC